MLQQVQQAMAARVGELRRVVAGLRRRWRRLALRALSLLLVAQLITSAVLTVVTQVRKRRQPQAGFPRARFEEVEVDGNRLQLYCYGAHLFKDMLDAIDQAQRSILLETYIWKGDDLGQLFKEHLQAKAAAGVEVYLIYDDFANLVVPARFKQFDE